MATHTEHESAHVQEEEETQGAETVEGDDDEVTSDGGLARLEIPGPEAGEE
jgi:hypothetical protein